MDLTSSFGDLPPSLQAAMKQRAAEAFDLASAPKQPAQGPVSLTDAGMPAERRKLPKWALPVGLAAAAALVYMVAKK